MNKKSLPLIALSLGVSFGMSAQTLKYPQTKKVEQTDNYFGTQIADPYRWLENDTAKDTEAWVKEENTLTQNYLSKIPFRQKLHDRLTELWNYPRYGAPEKEGEWYTFYKNDGLQNQAVLYVQKGLNGTPEVLLDPNKMSADGTVALQMQDVTAIDFAGAYEILDTGSPHYVQWVTDTETVDVVAAGRSIRNENRFQPKGINVNFVSRGDRGIVIRTYERGVEDETLACGTGVTAAAIVSAGRNTGHFDIPVKARGGDLRVTFEKEEATSATHIVLTGGAQFVFKGSMTIG